MRDFEPAWVFWAQPDARRKHHTLSILRYAEVYVGRGWGVVALHGVRENGGCTCRDQDCSRIGKHPHEGDGHYGATNSLATVEQWLTRWPGMNLGIHLGLSGLLALDADHQKVARIIQAEGYLKTYNQATSRGVHFLYASTIDGKKQTKVWALPFDVLVGNAYVVAAPSRIASGGTYRCEDLCAPVAPAPPFAPEIVAKQLGATSGDRVEAPRRASRRQSARGSSPLFPWAEEMLNNPSDLERDDTIRHSTPGYRCRHRVIWSILLHAVQRPGLSDKQIVGLMMASTLRAKAEESGDARRWFYDQVGKARQHVMDFPATAALSEASIEMANRDDAGLTATQRRLLWAHQMRAQQNGEGRYSVSLDDLAIDAKVSKSTARVQTQRLIELGWVTSRWRAPRGSRLASTYSLGLPARFQRVLQGRGEPNSPILTGGVGVGGVRDTPPPTSVPVLSDAFWYGRDHLGSSVLVLQALSTETVQSNKAIARRLSKDPATTREHLKRLEHHGLILRTDTGVLLHPDWEDLLDAVARGTSAEGRTDKRRAALHQARRDRRLRQTEYARANNLPMREDGSKGAHHWVDPSQLGIDAQHAQEDAEVELARDRWLDEWAEMVVSHPDLAGWHEEADEGPADLEDTRRDYEVVLHEVRATKLA